MEIEQGDCETRRDQPAGDEGDVGKFSGPHLAREEPDVKCRKQYCRSRENPTKHPDKDSPIRVQRT